MIRFNKLKKFSNRYSRVRGLQLRDKKARSLSADGERCSLRNAVTPRMDEDES